MSNRKTEYAESDFRVMVSAGSSMDGIEHRLLNRGTVEFILTVGFDVFLHHSDSHIEALMDSRVAPCDVVAMGNLSLGVGIYEFEGRSACVRFKSNAAAEMCHAAERAIDSFLKPLATRARNEYAEKEGLCG